MPGNAFGSIFRLTTFGESHGTAMGGIVDGVPAGVVLNLDRIQAELDRRRQAKGPTTQRKESDQVTCCPAFMKTHHGNPIGFTAPTAMRAVAIATTSPTAIARATLTSPTMLRGHRDHRGGGQPAHGKP